MRGVIRIFLYLLIAGCCCQSQAQLLNGPLYSVYFYPDKNPPSEGNGVSGRALFWLNASDGPNDLFNPVCAAPDAATPGGTIALRDSEGDTSGGVKFTYPPLYLTGTARNAPVTLGQPNGGDALEAYDHIYEPAAGQTATSSTFTYSGLTPGGLYDVAVYTGHVLKNAVTVSLNGGPGILLQTGTYNHGGWMFVGRTYHADTGIPGPDQGDYIELEGFQADAAGNMAIALTPAPGATDIQILGFQLAALDAGRSARPQALRLPAIYSDHAVLQAGKPVRVWGWANPGDVVTCTFSGDGHEEHFDAKTGDEGTWSGELAALPAGTSGEMEFRTDKGESTKITDLLVGEVWLGSGQSNMDYEVITTRRGGLEKTTPEMRAVTEKEAADSNGQIRYFATHIVKSNEPLDDVQGRWIVAKPGTVGDCFSVTWNFAVPIFKKLHCPVGLIDSAVGGTNVEAWTPLPALQALGATNLPKDVKEKYDAAMAAWMKENPTPLLQLRNRGSKPTTGRFAWAWSVLYNGMIHGFEPYSMRGFLWFQGDANENSWQFYSERMQAIIQAWRNDWKDQRLPFYYAEQPNYGIPQMQPVEYNLLSLIREQQQGALAEPLTGVAAAIDLGIQGMPAGKFAPPHFPNKKPLGDRMAGLALNDVYGFPGPVHSPEYKSFSIDGSKVRVKLNYADGLRVRGGGEVKGFAIRAAGGQWVWAQGKIDGQDIVLWNDQVPNPADARYAWAMNPVISIENGAGLPLRPFRTDPQSGAN